MSARSIVAGVSMAMMVASGCSSIQEEAIKPCVEGEKTPIEATFDAKSPNYERSTDPVVLAKIIMQEAVRVQNEVGKDKWTMHFHNQIVGIGQVVCEQEIEGSNLTKYYLTPRGAETGRSL